MAYPVSRADTKIIPGATFRSKERPTHGGIDFTPIVRSTELPVYSVGAGVVIIADRIAERGDTSGKDIGIRLDGDGSIWWYGHLSHVGVTVGQRVLDGQRVGRMGTTGSSSSGKASSTGVHLHLERHWPVLNVETDPWPYIEGEPDPSGDDGSKQPADDTDKAGAPATEPPKTITIPEDTMPMLIKIQGKDYFSDGRGYVLVKNETDRKQLDAALQTWAHARAKGEHSFGLGKYNGAKLLQYLDAAAK